MASTRERLKVALLALLFLVFFVLVFSSLTGCASTDCPPCPPPPDCPTIREPVADCPEPAVMPELVLPSTPAFPLVGSAPVVNAWLATFAETVGAREGILLDRIEVLEEQLDRYRHPPE
jgi:hypothetical protein